jgi:hypothetical protein
MEGIGKTLLKPPSPNHFTHLRVKPISFYARGSVQACCMICIYGEKIEEFSLNGMSGFDRHTSLTQKASWSREI